MLAAYLDGLAAGSPRVGMAPLDGSGGLAPDGDRVANCDADLERLSELAAQLALHDAMPGRDICVPDVPLAMQQAGSVRTACDVGLLVGLAHPCDPIDELVAAVIAAVTPFDDGSGVAAAAAAVAAAVSAGVAESSIEQRLALAAWGADAAAERAAYRPGPRLSARLTWACALAGRAEADPVDVLALLVGNSDVPQECVPAAFAVAATSPDVRSAIHAALALGGQADVIAAVAGAVAAGGRTAPIGTDAPLGAGASAAQTLVSGLLAHREATGVSAPR